MIEVCVFATLREGREKKTYVDETSCTTIADLLQHLAIAEHDVAICLLNGFHSTLDAQTKDGDVVSLFPPVGGG